MFKFFKEAIEGKGTRPPKTVTDSLTKCFGDVINVDWLAKDGQYEAIFYKNSVEYIAIFNTTGDLEKYKMYLAIEFLPAAIKTDLELQGEIMNVVLINDGKSILYEVILRDKQLIRALKLISQMGDVLEERLL